MKPLCPRVEQMAVSSRNGVSHRCFQIGGGGVNGLTLKPPCASARYPEFRNLPSHPKCCRTVRHSAAKSLATYRIQFTFEATRRLAVLAAVMVKRIGKGYVLTLVGKPPYEGESGGSTSKGVIFDCESGEKKGRIVIQCEPDNPAKVTKEELDEAIKQAADYLENELKAGRKPRRRYRLINGQMFRQ